LPSTKFWTNFFDHSLSKFSFFKSWLGAGHQFWPNKGVWKHTNWTKKLQLAASNIQMKKPKFQARLLHLPLTREDCKSISDGSFASRQETCTIRKLTCHRWDLCRTTNLTSQKIDLSTKTVQITIYRLSFHKYFSSRMKLDRKIHCMQLLGIPNQTMWNL